MNTTAEDKKAAKARYTAAYYVANRERLSKYHAAYRAAHREKAKAVSVKWRLENKDKERAMMARYRAENRAILVLRAREQYQKHKKRIKADNAAYKKGRPEQCRVYHINRKRRLADGVLSTDIVARLMIEQRSHCAYCTTDISRSYHLDHVHPVARGGRNIDDNVQLLCPACNLSKNDRDPHEFLMSVVRPKFSAEDWRA